MRAYTKITFTIMTYFREFYLSLAKKLPRRLEMRNLVTCLKSFVF